MLGFLLAAKGWIADQGLAIIIYLSPPWPLLVAFFSCLDLRAIVCIASYTLCELCFPGLDDGVIEKLEESVICSATASLGSIKSSIDVVFVLCRMHDAHDCKGF